MPCRGLLSEDFGLLVALAVDAVEPPTSLDSLTAWLVEVLALVVSVSAVAIAPPPLPIRSPVVSTQTPAARRSCVEILVSSHQQAMSSVGNEGHSRTVSVFN